MVVLSVDKIQLWVQQRVEKKACTVFGDAPNDCVQKLSHGRGVCLSVHIPVQVLQRNTTVVVFPDFCTNNCEVYNNMYNHSIMGHSQASKG